MEGDEGSKDVTRGGEFWGNKTRGGEDGGTSRHRLTPLQRVETLHPHVSLVRRETPTVNVTSGRPLAPTDDSDRTDHLDNRVKSPFTADEGYMGKRTQHRDQTSSDWGVSAPLGRPSRCSPSALRLRWTDSTRVG